MLGSLCAIAGNSDQLLLASPTYTKIVKSNRGLFGYKYVNDTGTPDARVLACAEPGFRACRLTNVITSILTPTQIDEISNQVDNLILSTRKGGNFVYQNTYFVLYSFVATDISKTTIEILTRPEAASRGYTF